MKQTKLMKVSYYDSKAEINLGCYSDTVVTERDGNISYIVAVRLGGYPEAVRGMAEAIFGGGSATFEIGGEKRTFHSRVKQYRKEYSHDGLYAEAVLRIKDEEQQALSGDVDGVDANNPHSGNSNNNNRNKEKGGNESPAAAPRKCYIFCNPDDEAQLFEEIDKKSSVPLITEFKEYVLTELQRRDILKPLQVISIHERFDAWILQMAADEKNIIDVVNDGLRLGSISIPTADTATTATSATTAATTTTAIDDAEVLSSHKRFPVINGVTQYLNTFGVQIAERIKGQFNPLFDPATEALSPEVLAVNDFIAEHAGYSLYDAQLAVIEAHKRCLERGKVTLDIAECGSGKSKIGVGALHAYQQRLHYKNNSNHTKCFNIILCPSHMAKKWVREIEESLPNTFAVIINNITELKKAYKVYEQNDMTCYVVITKEKARDGYMRRPAVVWKKRRRRFICPDCYATIEMDIVDCGSKYRVPADAFFFRKETKQNRRCTDCGSMLWTALAPEQQSEWVKVSDYGFVHRRFAYEYLRLVENKPKIYDAIDAIVVNPDGHFANSGAYRRFPLSTYIKRHMRGRIDGLVADELHNYNNNSGQGDAFGELFQAAKKVVGMTATLINGYSSGIFYLLYRISPSLMLRDNKSYEKPIDFNDEYGVIETVYEEDAPDYNANRRTVKRKIRERQLPGVSPLVYSRFLMESAAFLSLNDMGKDLPEYEEIPVQLEMNDDVASEYRRIEERFVDILKNQKEIAQKVLSVYLNLLTVYPDQPYGHEPVKHPIYGNNPDAEPLIVPFDTSSINELHEKDHHVLDIVRRKVHGDEETGELGGGRVLIYTSWTRIDTQTKLADLLTQQGYRVAILTASVPPKKREEWVEAQVENGVQVLICNPSLVETGLDLNDFTTLIFYNISWQQCITYPNLQKYAIISHMANHTGGIYAKSITVRL